MVASCPVATQGHRAVLALATLATLAAAPAARAGEGGVSHIMPGANATLVDLPPRARAGSSSRCTINYRGDATAACRRCRASLPTRHVTTNTLAWAAATASSRRCWAARTTGVAAFVPYTWVDISAQTASGNRQIDNSVSGLGDVTVVP